MDAQQLVSLLDLTSLNETDTEQIIKALCQKAHTPLGDVAAVCIYPQFVKVAASELQASRIKIATVCNFPAGDLSIEATLDEVHYALDRGAHEIDVVMPYQKFLKGDVDYVSDFLVQVRHACALETLKVILETGELQQKDLINRAATIAINAGANFIKTSTGKVKTGATIEAATAILAAIKAAKNTVVGIKISGGVRTQTQAKTYLSLIAKEMGEGWISPKTVRFGASALLDDIIHQL